MGLPGSLRFVDGLLTCSVARSARVLGIEYPMGREILITHGPPVGHGDRCEPAGHRAGCVDLLATVSKRVRPMYHVFGHIHEGYGATTDGTTCFVNASTCTSRYKTDKYAN